MSLVEKNKPGIAAVLSLIIPGVGQFYNGTFWRGIFWLIITDETRARKKIVEVSKGISRGIFIPNDRPSNYKCKNCSFKKNCDAWFMEAAA